MAQPDRVIILKQFQVAPPPNSVPTTSLPLTFLDIPWLLRCPMQRLFFYELPHSTHHFTQTILPTLSPSLSNTSFLWRQILYALRNPANPISSTPRETRPSRWPSLSATVISTTSWSILHETWENYTPSCHPCPQHTCQLKTRMLANSCACSSQSLQMPASALVSPSATW